jgi:hypothetical protein
MAVTAFVRKDSQGEEETAIRNNKRRKIDNGTSTTSFNKPKPIIKPQQAVKDSRGIANLFKRKRKSTEPPKDSLVDIYYFKAPQERNSVEELGIWERPDAEPHKLRALLEEKVVGMSDADKNEEREHRLRQSQRWD